MRIITALIVTGIVGAWNPAQAAEPSPEGVTFFEKNIRPILVERCYECHSKQGKKIRGGLSLDLKDGWVKGGSRPCDRARQARRQPLDSGGALQRRRS